MNIKYSEEKPALALDALAKLNRQFANKPEFNELVKTLLLTLSGQFSVGSAFSFLKKPGSAENVFYFLATGKYTNHALLESIKQSGKLIEFFLQHRTSILVSELVKNKNYPGFVRILDECNVRLVCPLIHNDSLLGVIGLGEKVTKRPYDTRDMDLFDTLMYSVTPLVASSYQFWEVTNLSAWYLDILNNVKQGVFAFDADFKLKKINDAGIDILTRYNKSISNSITLIGAKITNIFPENEYKDWSRIFTKAITENSCKSIDNLRANEEGADITYDAYISRIITSQEHQSDFILTLDDVTERRVAEGRVTCLNRLNEKLLGPGDLGDKLHCITETVFDTLKVDFARIWVTKPGDRCDSGCLHATATDGPHVCRFREQCLHLRASSGRYTHLDGEVHRRVPFGCYKIGRIASGAEPAFLTNDVTNDVRVHNREWASSLGLVSFAGQQILSANGNPIGVLAFFGKNAISLDEFAFFEVLANTASQVIQTAGAEEQQRDLQEKLERAERMEAIGILAGGVAHDLNNMLGPMVGYPELILRKLESDNPICKQVEKIANSAQSAAAVIQDLLTLARRGRYEMESINLNEVIKQYLDSQSFGQKTEKNPRIDVKCSLDDKIGNIMGSSSHLYKVMMNLVVNAFDAMPEGGKITIETSQKLLKKLPGGFDKIEKGEYIILRVCDTGHGINDEDIGRIFEPYYSKKKMDSSGSGLGLSVVYGIVKDHKGYYDVFSKPKEGTEFAIYLPVTLEKATPEVAVEDKINGTENILIIDDSDIQRDITTEILKSLGYAVQVVNNGHQALDYLRVKSADLVVLDMIMEPGFDGLDTYREIKKICPDQRAVVISGFSATERVEEIRQLGAGAYVKKPFTLKAIGRAVREELDRK